MFLRETPKSIYNKPIQNHNHPYTNDHIFLITQNITYAVTNLEMREVKHSIIEQFPKQELASYIKQIQDVNKDNTGTGIGFGGTYLSGTDLSSLNQSLFPNAEIFYQYFPDSNRVFGIIRLDRILRRYILNSGIKNVFLDNIISEFGVGDPNSINDDINTYIDLNIATAYEGGNFNLYVKKTASETIPISNLIIGDITSYQRATTGYSLNENYTLTQINNLAYNFTFDMEKNFNYSLSFSIPIIKI